MTEALCPCPACHRHVRARESACPFCDTSLRGGAPATALVVGAVLAAALVSPTPTFAQSPRQELGQAPATAYGAPPDLDPLRRPPELVIPRRPEPAQDATVVRVQEFELQGALDPTLLRRALQARYPQLRRCLSVGGIGDAEQAIRGEVVIDASGRVVRAQIEAASAARARCLRAALRAGRWPATGRRVAVRVAVQREGGGRGMCRGPSPAGCRSTGCEAGFVCDTRVRCVPSSCGCDPGTGRWTCTADCGGGVCVPARREPVAGP